MGIAVVGQGIHLRIIREEEKPPQATDV